MHPDELIKVVYWNTKYSQIKKMVLFYTFMCRYAHYIVYFDVNKDLYEYT